MQLLVIGQIGSEMKVAIDIAQKRQARVFFASSNEEALDTLRSGKGADLILIDAKSDIASLCKALALEHINAPVVAYGVSCTPKEAVDAIKAGAKEFMPLPPDEKLIAAIFTEIADDARPSICHSESMKYVMHVASKVAKSDANILITGKSGTGKEVLASYIHMNSARSSKPFVRVNCAAIPENLIESELFGHEKGAFTGAIARRIGKFEESSGGTLLLDEISEMDIRLQSKLLRAIQEQEIDRVGGTQPIKVDLRIIATSNRDLPEEIQKGTFREDLYFRLNIINIELPKLSDRRDDIADLSMFFIKKYSENNRLPIKHLSREALEALLSHSWPGNIRELENVLHRAVLLSSDREITASDLMLNKNTNLGFAGKKLADAEHELIAKTVSHCLGNNMAAANILGISIATLKEKLEYYSNKSVAYR
ncbi:MAG: sigma-54 dependent transcriptional regulator [Pseudomonadota bacterium]